MTKELEDLGDITWKRVIEECLKDPDDPIAQVFLEVEAKLKAQRTIIRDQSGWIAELQND